MVWLEIKGMVLLKYKAYVHWSTDAPAAEENQCIRLLEVHGLVAARHHASD